MKHSFQKLVFIGGLFSQAFLAQFSFAQFLPTDNRFDLFSDRLFNTAPIQPVTPFESLRNFLAKKVGLDLNDFEQPTYHSVKTIEMYAEDFFDRCYLTLDFRKYPSTETRDPRVIEGFRVGLKSEKVELYTLPITRESRVVQFNHEIFLAEHKTPDMCETQGCVEGEIIHSRFNAELVDIKGIVSQRWGYDEVGQKKCFFPKSN
jgi:hypothetical protein